MAHERVPAWRLVRDQELPAADEDLATVAEFLREVTALLRRLDPGKPILTVEDIADWLRITPRGVRHLLDRSEIPWARLGRRRVVLRDQLLDRVATRARERARRPFT